MQDFKKLEIWNASINFSVKIYELTKNFPREEKYGITSQLRRAAVSICSNIAEGAGRRTPSDFRQFLYIAMGSINECETLLVLAEKLNYSDITNSKIVKTDLESIGRRLNRLISCL